MLAALLALALQGVFVPPPTAADLAAQMQAQGLIPAPASSTPQAEAVGGAVGASTTYMRADAKMPRITRANTFTVGASGVLAGAWANPTSANPLIIFTPIATGTGRITCELTAAPTTTSFSGRCWQDQVVAVNSTTVLSGLNIGPSVAPQGTQVQVVAIPPAT